MTSSQGPKDGAHPGGSSLEAVLRESRLRALENEALVGCAKVVLRGGSFRDAARAIFDIAKRVTGAQSGYVALLGEGGGENEVLFLDSGGLPCTVDPHLPMPVRGLRSEAYRSGQVVYENDFPASEWMKYMPQGHVRLENVLFAPLVIEGEAVGLIGLANKPDGFTGDDARIAGSLGEFAAIALRNSINLEALSKSERTFRAIIESSPYAVILSSGTEEKVEYLNSRFREMFGYTPEEIPDVAHWWPLAYPDEEYRKEVATEWQRRVEAAVHTGSEIEPMETVVSCKDGTKRTIEFRLVSNGEKNLVFGADVTQRKRAEQALTRREAELHATLYGIGDGVISTDKEGCVVRMNPVACRLTGWMEGEAAGRPLQEVFPIFDEKTGLPIENPVARVLSEKAVCGVSNHAVLRSRLGGEVPIADSAAPIFDHQGSIKGVVLIFRDQAEERLSRRLTEMRFSLIEYAAAHTLDELLTRALDEISAFSGSPIGFYHFVEPDQKTLSLQQWSTRTLKEFCRARGKWMHYGVEKAGVWVDCVHRREPVIHNDYASLPHRKGLPEGHLEVVRELVVPVMRDGKVVAILGVGNKRDEYTRKDAEAVSYLADVTWEIVQHKKAEEGLRGRVRELTCLYSLSREMREDSPMDEFCRRALDHLGSALQFPGLTAAVLEMDGRRFGSKEDTGGFGLGCRAEIVAKGRIRGQLRVYHAAERPPLLPEEQSLVNGIAEALGARVERKTAEDSLRRSESLLKKAQAIARLGSWELDLSTDRLTWSEEVHRMFGVQPQEFEGTYEAFLDMVHPDDRAVVDAAYLGSVRESRDNYEVDHRIIRRDSGEVRVVHEKCEHVRDGKGRVVRSVGMVQDITESRKAEEEREKLQAQLRQAQKMESVGRLAGGVAHDFNNKLGIIIGSVEMAMMEAGPGDPIYSQLEDILKAAERSAELVRQLLAFARKQTVSPKILDLNDTVSGMLQMLRRLVGEDVALAWIPCPDPCLVKMDPSQIDQILANLAVNARDAIAGVGRMTIETKNVSIDDSYCASHPGFTRGDFVLLAVSDDGAGMGREVLEHLFEPFFTTKEVGKGTGLGLSTVFGIVKQNGGFINVYSEPGRGTTFRIYIPRLEDVVAEAAAETRPDTAPRGWETVLMVEDEAAILRIGKSMLESLGYTALIAENPKDAIRIARERSGLIHLLLTDVVMPEMNGKALAQEIKRFYPEMKCLFMSGYTADVIAHHGVLDEGVNFIQKPFSMKDLAAKLRQVLQRPEGS